jgi:ubiquinone/menaquinone biosynthesis C-methylase UbiE
MDDKQLEAMFSGVIGTEYDTLKLICPLAAKMSQLVGEAVADYAVKQLTELRVLELGGGTGITTLSILLADKKVKVLSVDSEPTMQDQAKQSLKKWSDEGRLSFDGRDALTVLKELESDSLDILASAYTLHNFLDSYRTEVLQEIYRVLKVSGLFVNGDRYGLDDISSSNKNVDIKFSAHDAIFE